MSKSDNSSSSNYIFMNIVKSIAKLHYYLINKKILEAFNIHIYL
jgi:hypothetical protein